MAQYPTVAERTLGSYLDQREGNRRASLEELQGAVQVQGMLARQQQMQLQNQFRKELSDLGPNPTEKQILTLATKFTTDPKDILHYLGQQSVARQAAADRTTQSGILAGLAGRRLDQTDRRLDQGDRRTDYLYGGAPPSIRLGGASGPLGPVNPPPQASTPPPVSAPPLSAAEVNERAPQASAVLSPQLATDQMGVLWREATGGGIPTSNVVQGSRPPSAAPTATSLPPMPPEIASSPRVVQDRWRLQQTRQTGGERTPESLTDDVYYQLINGKPRPGSIPTGSAGQGNAYRTKFADELNRISKDLGMTPAELASRGGENKAKFTALAQIEKDYAAIKPYKAMLDLNANIAIELGNKIVNDKTNSAYLNRPILWVKNNVMNRPDIAEYLFQMHIVETEGARVLVNPRLVGQLTDTAIRDMKSVVSGNMTLESSVAVLERMKSDGTNRVSQLEAQRTSMINDIRKPGGAAGASNRPRADQFFR